MIPESRVCLSYLYTMQVGRWSVKNQCICFTNFHNQSSQHPVKWLYHWKTWMISWPTHPPHTHPATNNQTNSKKQKQQKTNNNNTHNNNNHNKQTTTTTTTKQQILSTFNLFDCIVFCVLCWLFTSFYFVVFFLLSSVYFVAVDETNQTWTEWWKDKRCSSEQDKN